MNSEEINRILSFQTCKIVAPAGHGKTEMISQLVLLSEGTQLILTHTNAGVDALRKRMVKNHVPNKKYTIFEFKRRYVFLFSNVSLWYSLLILILICDKMVSRVVSKDLSQIWR